MAAPVCKSLIKQGFKQPLTEVLRARGFFKISHIGNRSFSHATPTVFPQQTLIYRRSPRGQPTLLRSKRALTTTPRTKYNSISGSSYSSSNMSSDQDYAAFLDKANEDPAKGVASSTAQGGTKKKLRTTQQGVEVPAPLVRVCRDAFYTSDADEPFEAVALAWDEGGKGLPDEEEFARLIEHWDPEHAEIEIQDPVDWDSRGQYKEVVDAVREAGEGNDVRVYRVNREGARAEYWVVTTEGKGKGAKLVGVKALAVES